MALAIIFQRLQQKPQPVCDYHVTVKVTTSPTTMDTIENALVTKHVRDDGFAMLLLRYLEQHHPELLIDPCDMLSAVPRYSINSINDLNDLMQPDEAGDWVELSKVKYALAKTPEID